MERLRMQVILDILYRRRSGQSERAIAKDLGHSRITIRRYRQMAARKGYLVASVPLPEVEQLALELGEDLRPAPNNISSVEPYREIVKSLIDQDVEMAAIHGMLMR